MRRPLLCGLLVGLALPGAAAAQTLHDIDWYVTHPAERNVTLQLCQSDVRIGRLPDCANADLAATRAATLRHHVQTPAEALSDPEYWRTNRFARWGALANCERPNRGGFSASDCAAARAAELSDRVR